MNLAVVYAGLGVIVFGCVIILLGAVLAFMSIRKVKAAEIIQRERKTLSLEDAAEILKALDKLYKDGGWALVLVSVGLVLVIVGAGLVGSGLA